MEADDDRRDSFGGITDDPLIDSGREYGKKVGELLKDKNIEAIYTSPYLRAKETAEIINKSINKEVVVIYNLRERSSYGVMSGVEKERAKTLFPAISARIQEMKQEGVKPSKTVESLPGAEIYLNLVLRAKDAFNQIFRESKLIGFKTIAVITHGGFSWAFFRNIMKIDKKLAKGEIYVLEGDNLNNLKVNEKETKELK